MLMLNSVAFGAALAECKYIYDYIGLFFGATDLFFVGCYTTLLLFNFLFILLVNNFSLRGRFAREEMQKINAEEVGLVLAKKRLLQHPDNPELQLAYSNLVSAVIRSRQEDE